MTTSQKIMEYKGFKARIMEAQRLTGEYVHSLPPGNPLDVYPSDIFVEYPEQWMKGPEVFVVPVRANKGLWFDWTMNSKINTAVVPTVKGCNPITGLQTSGINLERYEDKCPKHGTRFEGERYCPTCGYKWAPQNYVAAPNTLWWDGFRGEDGSVRQFFFTEDELRDIATHMIGKENTVPAFGFAFYEPKNMRQKSHSSIFHHDYTPWIFHHDYPPWVYTSNSTTKCVYSSGGSSEKSLGGMPLNHSSNLLLSKKARNSKSVPFSSSASYSNEISFNSVGEDYTTSSLNLVEEIKEVSIGAGAKIEQAVEKDFYPLDSWRDKPSASMVIYFVFQEKLDQMLSKGVKDLTGKKEGMLDGLPVG